MAAIRLGISLMVVLLAHAVAQAQEDTSAKIAVNIEPQPIGGALQMFGKQTGVQALYRSEEAGIGEVRTAGVSGMLSPREALGRLLKDTGLKYEFVNEHTVRVSSATAGGNDRLGEDTKKEVGKSASPDFLAAQMDQGASQSLAAVNQPTESTPGSVALQEVIVTAQKKEERLQQVPVPVSVINTEKLVSSNQLRLQDYYTSVPGLNVAPAVQSTQVVSIRGITTGYGTNPTVGITVDDVPYGASTNLGGGDVIPDFDPGDLKRVEVLRGPQGTLYGASSLGGLIKFVTVDPSTAGYSADVQAATDSVYNGAELGYRFSGAINVPLSDTLAFRASAFKRRDVGYVDNPVLHIDGINEARGDGGRISALWRPSDTFSLKFGALYQGIRSDGSDDIDFEPGLGDLQQNYLPNVGGYNRKVQAYSAVTHAQFSGADLTSVTGYNINSYRDTFDYTSALAFYTQPLFGVPGTVNVDNNRTNKFTQEIRLAMPLGQRLDGLLGLFYTYEKSQFTETTEAEDGVSGDVIPGSTDNLDFPSTFQEYAVFADLTVKINDRFDIQFGGRESHIKQSIIQSEIGPYVELFYGIPSPYLAPESDSSANAFTYLVTPRFRITPEIMVYARLASGYRAGGPNVGQGIPNQYDPDKTQNYEVGLKGDFLDHKLSVDSSVYYIQWKNIQINLSNPLGVSYNANGAQAKSEGLELAMTARPLPGLSVEGWVNWDEAVLTEDLPQSSTAVGLSGDRLPDTSRFSGHGAVQQAFPLWSGAEGNVGATVSYIGARSGTFPSVYASPPQRQYYAPYAKTDLHAGIRFNSWNVNLYANNVTNRRGLLSGGIGDFPTFAFKIIQPRTTGVSISKMFGQNP